MQFLPKMFLIVIRVVFPEVETALGITEMVNLRLLRIFIIYELLDIV